MVTARHGVGEDRTTTRDDASPAAIGRAPINARPVDARRGAARLVASLCTAQNADGGWGAEPGRPSNTEATGLGVLALDAWAPAAHADAEGSEPPELPGRAQDSAQRATRWLLGRQRDDGSWPVSDQVDGPSWTTAVAVLALALTGADPQRARRGGEWLVGQEGAAVAWFIPMVLWMDRLRGRGQSLDMNPTLKGWPWLANTSSWVEPTSVSMLALRALARDSRPGSDVRRARRIYQGERLLLDRMVPSGGWNYGSPRVLGEDLEAFPDTTAWALLALVGARHVERQVAASLAALERLMQATASPLARSLAVLAYRAHGKDADALTRALAEQALGPEPPADARTRALAVLALAGPTNPFLGAPRA